MRISKSLPRTVLGLIMAGAVATHTPAIGQSNSPGFDVNGKYSDLITTYGCAEDVPQYGAFYDWGYWAGGYDCGADRPAGYYVWYQGAWAVWSSASGTFPDAPATYDPDHGFDVGGKYYGAIANFGCAADVEKYGDFYDYGYWSGGNYCGADRPAGYYVWYQGAWAVWSTKVK